MYTNLLNNFPLDLHEIPAARVEEAFSYLLSTHMPRVERAEKTAQGARLDGMGFCLYENGLCSVCSIDNDVTHARIPHAIIVDGKSYLVVSFMIKQPHVVKALKSLHLSATLVRIILLNIPSLETITGDDYGKYRVLNGALYDVSSNSPGWDMIWFPPDYRDEKFLLPDALRHIDSDAFFYCRKIPTFTGETDYWNYNDTIHFPQGYYITKDGNVYKEVATLYEEWEQTSGGNEECEADEEYEESGGYYKYALLKKIGNPQKSLSLNFYIDRHYPPVVLHGIDLDTVCEPVRVLHLYGVSDVPENFFRRMDLLPNLDNFYLEDDEFIHEIPDLVFYEGLVMRPITADREELAIDKVSEYVFFNDEGTLSIPGDFSDGDDTYKVTSIGKEAFKGQFDLRNVIIPDTVKNIEEEAFAQCSGLTRVHIPDSVVEIGKRAFSRCRRLTHLNIPDSVTSIGDEAFEGCRLMSLYIPASLISVGWSVFAGLEYLTKINVNEGNPAFCSVDGVLYNASMTRLIRYPQRKKETVFEIPSTVTEIGPYAFQDCKNLESIVIPDSVRVIGDYAFHSCRKLSRPFIPLSVTSVGKDIFSPD